jgi:deoxyribodipyrimidine photo-lyase
MGESLERSEILQRTVPPEQVPSALLRREFASRGELTAYLAAAFPSAAARGASVSEIPGGRAAALRQLAAIQPAAYARSRNFLSGAVSRLSPYLRHGVLSLAEVRRHARSLVNTPIDTAKFINELAWRDYWRRLYANWGDAVWVDREPVKTGLPPSAYRSDLPADIPAAATGLACMDAFSRELQSTGYVHNHARMWLAAYIIHWRRVAWQAGARWFLTHLLDGDPASNNLSFQWVASTFSHKPYFFNRENLSKYTADRYCRECLAACPFDAGYNQLSARLFQIEEARP